ncbi:MAG TPA: phosphatase PAP2 family protein [Spirochaetota bacterium]|nr:phosphatase PAP2 family protein [Spirochaetota bacterium]
MEQVWQWGIDIIIIIQKIRTPFFDSMFTFISSLGTQMFYMLIIPVLYWCFDRRTALRIVILIFISSWLNSVTKDFISHPRPYNIDATVKVGHTGGPGIPSGHAQQSLVLWAYLAVWIKKPLFTIFAVLLVLAIALSRLYLGVHFPTDILGGWILGIILLVASWRLFDRIETEAAALNAGLLTAASIIIPVLLSWVYASRWSIAPMGALSGFCAGLIIGTGGTDMAPADSFKKGFLRYVSGIIILFIIFFGGKFLFTITTPGYLVYLFIHSWIMGLWISAGAPRMFAKLKLS